MAPVTIERPSVAAYSFPSARIVSRELRATEGAAPKRPAKLLGLRISQGRKQRHNKTADDETEKVLHCVKPP